MFGCYADRSQYLPYHSFFILLLAHGTSSTKGFDLSEETCKLAAAKPGDCFRHQ
jgi:hypothetical protein